MRRLLGGDIIRLIILNFSANFSVNLYLINNAFIPLAVRYILFTLHIYHVATSIVFIVFKFLKS